MSNQNQAEFGDSVNVDVTLRGNVRKFVFHDITKADFDALYAPVEAAKDDAQATAAANRQLMLGVISKVVRREDGTEITPDQANTMSVSLFNKLGAKAFAFVSGEDHDAAGEKEVAKEVEEKKD